MMIQIYTPTKANLEKSEGIKFLYVLQFHDDLKMNCVRWYSSNKYNSNILLLLNECVIDADFSAWNSSLCCSIYHENSIVKIRETKSLLEEKTGWELRRE